MDHIGLCCCVDFSVVAESRGCSLVVIPRLLIVVTSLFAEHGLWGVWASVVVARELSNSSRPLEHRLSSCGARAKLLHSMWDLSGSGMEPVSPALPAGFSTTEPPGKPPKINTFEATGLNKICVTR